MEELVYRPDGSLLGIRAQNLGPDDTLTGVRGGQVYDVGAVQGWLDSAKDASTYNALLTDFALPGKQHQDTMTAAATGGIPTVALLGGAALAALLVFRKGF